MKEKSDGGFFLRCDIMHVEISLEEVNSLCVYMWDFLHVNPGARNLGLGIVGSNTLLTSPIKQLLAVYKHLINSL